MAFWRFDRKDPAPPPAEGEPPPSGGSPPVCLACGGERAPGRSSPVACTLCGRTGPAAERCRAGHSVCQACLSGPAGELVERTCAASEERDPVALALRLVRHPGIRLAPEDHDLLVPSVLVAAWSNVRGEVGARAARVHRARVRVERVLRSENARPPGNGAAEGAGAFVAVVVEATRGADDAVLVDRMVTRARALVGDGGDASCLRRNALVAVLAAARFAKETLGAELPARGLECERAGENPSCVGAGCPFNR